MLAKTCLLGTMGICIIIMLLMAKTHLKKFPRKQAESRLELGNKELKMVRRWQWEEIMLTPMTEDIPRQIPFGMHIYVSEPQICPRNLTETQKQILGAFLLHSRGSFFN